MSADEERPGGAAEQGGERRLDELIDERRAKARALRAGEEEDFPYSFPGVVAIADVHERFDGLDAGAETEERRRVAGRLAARREQGGAAFLDLVDRSGRLQLYARRDGLGEEGFGRLLDLDLGDWVGADGSVMKSRRGELSLRVERFVVLAKSLRPPPDKHHGLSDVELRHRRRELDLIANEDTRAVFLSRAKVIAAVRSYLDREGFIEVETPVLQPVYGGALARPFTTHHNELDRDLYLRIATELYLKRLIVGGLERVYELGKDFRNEGVSHKHNPEFTMVEWYEAYADYRDEAARLEALAREAADVVGYDGEVDFTKPWRRVAFAEAIEEATGIDVMAHTDAASLAGAISEAGLGIPTEGLPWFALADDLLSKCVEPKLHEPTFVFDYPLELSPFAREHRSDPRLVERWEAFAGGMEIANAFSELNDADAQRERFEAQQRLRALGAQDTQPHDELFLEALEHGMPPTGGVGLGIDRLVMVLTGQSSIREVVLFPAMRQ
jgi:lysyl-tRNA synthetase class 2